MERSSPGSTRWATTVAGAPSTTTEMVTSISPLETATASAEAGPKTPPTSMTRNATETRVFILRLYRRGRTIGSLTL